MDRTTWWTMGFVFVLPGYMSIMDVVHGGHHWIIGVLGCIITLFGWAWVASGLSELRAARDPGDWRVRE